MGICDNIIHMKKTINIVDLVIDQRLTEECFALNEFEKKISRQDKPYYNVALSDKTGEIRAKLWSEGAEISDLNLNIGDIVCLSGVVQEYNGKLQIIIEKIAPCANMAPEEFLPVTDRDRSVMTQDLQDAIDAVNNPYLKKLLLAFWQNSNLKDRFVNFPAGEYVHHGYVGGLLEHVWEMWQLSQPFLKIYNSMLDRDLFFTGLFFHDIGKIEELDIVGATIVRTTSGRLVAHIGQGLIIIDRLINDNVSEMPQDLREKLYHMILSHQGDLEMGSPIKPQTLEALVLSLVDKCGAEMNQATKHIQKSLTTGQEFTDYHKWLGRSFYQKDYLLCE